MWSVSQAERASYTCSICHFKRKNEKCAGLDALDGLAFKLAIYLCVSTLSCFHINSPVKRCLMTAAVCFNIPLKPGVHTSWDKSGECWFKCGSIRSTPAINSVLNSSSFIKTRDLKNTDLKQKNG